jgi:hypothetical protein
MTQQQIKQFYKAYKQQILDEMQEYYDMPLKHVEKIDDNKYIAYEDNIKVIFIFTRRFGGDLERLPNIVDKKLVKEYYEISWTWDPQMDEIYKTTKNFLKVSGTSFKIIYDFIRSKPNIQIIAFSGLLPGHNSIYSGSFSKKLKHIFGGEYRIYINSEDSQYMLINKSVLDIDKHGGVQKLSQQTSLLEAIIKWEYPLLHPSTPSNVKIKAKIKQKILKNIYCLK